MSVAAPPVHVEFRGMLFMLLAIWILTGMDALAKVLVVAGTHAIVILALRALMVVPSMVGYHLIRGEAGELVPKRPLALLARGVAGFLAPLCFFSALGYIPLSNAMLVFFSSAFMITILSILFLGERVGPHRWISIAVGYVGVAIVIGPSLANEGGDLLGYLLALVASTAYAILFVSGRHLSATESTSMLVLSFNLVAGLLALALLPWYWTPIDGVTLGLIGCIAVLALAGHLCITRAFTMSEGSLLAPLEYTALLFTLFYDAVLFEHVPTPTTWFGALVIVGSGLYVAYRERRSAGARVPATARR